MSRSRKKSPVTGITVADSEAQDKRLWHKRLRAMTRARLAHEDDPFPVAVNEASSPWLMSKDGKRWWGRSFPLAHRK